jgi:phospholipase C
LTVNLALTFKSTFSGLKNSYGWVQDTAGTVTNWTLLGSWTGTTASATAISHVLFMLQENHSFDNYFGRMGQYRANKGFNDSFDGVPLNASYSDANGKAVSPYHLATVCTEDLAPGWDPQHLDTNRCNTDTFFAPNIEPQRSRVLLRKFRMRDITARGTLIAFRCDSGSREEA